MGAGMVAMHKAHSGFPSGARSGQEGRGGAERKTLQPLKKRLSNTWVSLALQHSRAVALSPPNVATL